MPRFDPDTGKKIGPLDDIAFRPAGSSSSVSAVQPDGSRVTQTVNPDTGKVDGFVTEHGDGRQDCDVFAPAIVTGANAHKFDTQGTD